MKLAYCAGWLGWGMGGGTQVNTGIDVKKTAQTKINDPEEEQEGDARTVGWDVQGWHQIGTLQNFSLPPSLSPSSLSHTQGLN